jgi:hypothetical protein
MIDQSLYNAYLAQGKSPQEAAMLAGGAPAAGGAAPAAGGQFQMNPAQMGQVGQGLLQSQQDKVRQQQLMMMQAAQQFAAQNGGTNPVRMPNGLLGGA